MSGWFSAAKTNNTTYLKRHPQFIRTADASGRTALMVAIEHESLEAAAFLLPLEFGAVDARGWSALSYAMMTNNIDLINMLLPFEHETPVRTPITRLGPNTHTEYIALLLQSADSPLFRYYSRTLRIALEQTRAIADSLLSAKRSFALIYDTVFGKACQCESALVTTSLEGIGCIYNTLEKSREALAEAVLAGRLLSTYSTVHCTLGSSVEASASGSMPSAMEAPDHAELQNQLLSSMKDTNTQTTALPRSHSKKLQVASFDRTSLTTTTVQAMAEVCDASTDALVTRKLFRSTIQSWAAPSSDPMLHLPESAFQRMTTILQDALWKKTSEVQMSSTTLDEILLGLQNIVPAAQVGTIKDFGSVLQALLHRGGPDVSTAPKTDIVGTVSLTTSADPQTDIADTLPHELSASEKTTESPKLPEGTDIPPIDSLPPEGQLDTRNDDPYGSDQVTPSLKRSKFTISNFPTARNELEAVTPRGYPSAPASARMMIESGTLTSRLPKLPPKTATIQTESIHHRASSSPSVRSHASLRRFAESVQHESSLLTQDLDMPLSSRTPQHLRQLSSGSGIINALQRKTAHLSVHSGSHQRECSETGEVYVLNACVQKSDNLFPARSLSNQILSRRRDLDSYRAANKQSESKSKAHAKNTDSQRLRYENLAKPASLATPPSLVFDYQMSPPQLQPPPQYRRASSAYQSSLRDALRANFFGTNSASPTLFRRDVDGRMVIPAPMAVLGSALGAAFAGLVMYTK